MSDVNIRAIQTRERPAAADLVARVFSHGANRLYDSIYQHWMYAQPQNPHYSVNAYRGAFLGDGTLVSIARAEDFILRYGQARIRTGLISAVCTHPHHRQNGYAAAIVRDALTYATEQGNQMVLLQGIREYYDQFGFMSVWPKYTLTAPVDEARQLPQPLAIRQVERDHLPQMAHLYTRHWGGRVTFARDPATWVYRLRHGYGSAVVAVDTDERVRGYLWHDDSLSDRVEVVADTPEATSTLLAYDAARWREGAREMLEWAIPPDDVIIPYAQQWLPLTVSAHYDHSGGWMARVVDFAALLRSLLPEIRTQAQVLASDFDVRQLQMDVQSDSITLALANVDDSQCRLSLRDFVQLLFGSLRPTTLALRQPLTRDAMQLLDLLFPPRVASIAAWDWS